MGISNALDPLRHYELSFAPLGLLHNYSYPWLMP